MAGTQSAKHEGGGGGALGNERSDLARHQYAAQHPRFKSRGPKNKNTTNCSLDLGHAPDLASHHT